MRRGESKAKGLKRGGRIRSAPTKAKARAGHKDASSGSLAIQLAAKTRELNEALAQQAATAEVLKVISRSTFDLQTVLNTLVELAARLCEADQAAMNRYDESAFAASRAERWRSGATRRVHRVHARSPDSDGTGVHCRPGHRGMSPVQIPDVLADADYEAKEVAKAIGLRTMLAVPLMREGAPIGSIALQRHAVRPFTKKQIELVETFADQAVIAIENARLFDEVQARTKQLTESLEQQTATSEVLQVISSSPGELAPVFETILENATRVCEAKFGNLLLYEAVRSELSRFITRPRHLPKNTADAVRSHALTVRAGLARTKKLVHVPDLRTAPLSGRKSDSRAMAERGGARSCSSCRCSRMMS